MTRLKLRITLNVVTDANNGFGYFLDLTNQIISLDDFSVPTLYFKSKLPVEAGILRMFCTRRLTTFVNQRNKSSVTKFCRILYNGNLANLFIIKYITLVK